MTDPTDVERPFPSAGPGLSDTVTASFGDPAADVYGVGRLTLSMGATEDEVTASAMGILFAAGAPVAVRAATALPVAEPAWETVEAAGVRTAVVEPLAAWRLSFSSEDGAAGFDLELRSCSALAVLGGDDPAVQTGGLEGYEQLCRVTGTVTGAGTPRTVDCLGQRSHSWGAPAWERISLVRSVSAWLEEDLAVALTAVRPADAAGHDAESIAAFLLEPGRSGEGPLLRPVGDPRLSTLYDAEGRQRRAGLELYVDEEDDHARRLAGHVACGTSVDLGRLRLECAFFRWQMEGRSGAGRYDVLRRV